MYLPNMNEAGTSTAQIVHGAIAGRLGQSNASLLEQREPALVLPPASVLAVSELLGALSRDSTRWRGSTCNKDSTE